MDSLTQDQLINTSVEETLNALRLKDLPVIRKMAKTIVKIQAKKFVEIAAEFDTRINRFNINQAAQWALTRFVHGIEVQGAYNIPKSGPLLVVSNHPGGVDSLAVIDSIPRNDLQILTNDRALLRLLPNTSRHMIFMDQSTSNRMAAMRVVCNSLANHGSVLIFPSGELEPDPVIVPGAVSNTAKWSNSIGVFLKKYPETYLLPIIVRGVVSPEVYSNPLLKLTKHTKQRQKNALFIWAIVQMFWPNFHPVEVMVNIGTPVKGSQIVNSDSNIETGQNAIKYVAAFLSSLSPI